MPYETFANQEYRNFFQTRLEIPLLVRTMRIERGLRILEIGCGRGVALPRLTQLCVPSQLAAVDIDPELVTLARARAQRFGVAADIRLADCRALPFDDDTFDLVIDFGTCYHIDEPERALAEVSRVLSPLGAFVHESPLAQLMAHPFRSSGRRLRFTPAMSLVLERSALLWQKRRKVTARVPGNLVEESHVALTA